MWWSLLSCENDAALARRSAVAEVAEVVEAPPAPTAPPAWPAAGALRALDPARPRSRVLLDAGHGAEGNSGNTNAKGESEQDVMRRVADAVVAEWALEGLQVERTRPDAALVSYDARLSRSAHADLLVSLHSDARAGSGQTWIDAAAGTWRTEGATGFAVLWSDEGEAARVEPRRRLAQATARRLAEAGFLPYPGLDYPGLYEADAETPGMFVDRHALPQRIRLLRRPPVPSIIIETHEAHDLDEVRRWEEAATTHAFARALAAALVDFEGG